MPKKVPMYSGKRMIALPTPNEASSNDDAESGDSPVAKQLKAQINALRQRLLALHGVIRVEAI